MQRTLGILERLAAGAEGVSLATLADELNLPRSAAHRLLAELIDLGYVRQSRERGDYQLTTRLVSLGFAFLKSSGIVDLSQPILDRLAEASGELARLGVVDGDRLTWVAKAQGARPGLRYDPDMGSDARLACTASGHAWLATLDDAAALALAAKQGFGDPGEYGPQAPATPAALMKALKATRKQGYATTVDTYAPGLAAVAACIRPREQPALGVIAVSGPSVRLTTARMHALAPQLVAAADELVAASAASPLFRRR